jgi:hypothetical protein
VPQGSSKIASASYGEMTTPDVFARKEADMTGFKLVLMATATAVTAIGVAATAHAEPADPETHFFQDPSGNIKCETTPAVSYKSGPYANCIVRDAAYAVPTDACHFSGSAPNFQLMQDQAPNLTCVLEVGEYQWPTLDFGQTRSVGTITCDSEVAGVTCTDTGTGRFFRTSTDSYDLG